jgi:putative ABC transport system permease protein
MNSHCWTFLAAEIRESFSMAMSAVAAHKLRSALTLLGVLVGVFSIIVVMTAMRVLQSNIERRLSGLGTETFMVRKFPGVYFGGADGFEKFWRRKNITLADGMKIQEKATLARSVGVETSFWGGQIETRFKKTAPTVQLYGETPGSFPARNWNLAEGRVLQDVDVAAPWRPTCFPLALPLARSSKSMASTTLSWAFSSRKACPLEACRTTLPSYLSPPA